MSTAGLEISSCGKSHKDQKGRLHEHNEIIIICGCIFNVVLYTKMIEQAHKIRHCGRTSVVMQAFTPNTSYLPIPGSFVTSYYNSNICYIKYLGVLITSDLAYIS